jgi:hypothetical protein
MSVNQWRGLRENICDDQTTLLALSLAEVARSPRLSFPTYRNIGGQSARRGQINLSILEGSRHAC